METTDHLLALILAVLYPVYAKFSYDQFKEKVRREGSARKIIGYYQTIGWLWFLLLLGVAAWSFAGRPTSSLFVPMPETEFLYAGYALTALLTGFTIAQYIGIKRANEETVRKFSASFQSLKEFLPETRKELRTFYAASVTAGITEELLYRAFLIWYLSAFLGLWGAVIASSAIFGFAHFYQGINGILKTGFIGLVFALIYVLTGSVLLAIIMHAFYDIVVGKTIHHVLSRNAKAD